MSCVFSTADMIGLDWIEFLHSLNRPVRCDGSHETLERTIHLRVFQLSRRAVRVNPFFFVFRLPSLMVLCGFRFLALDQLRREDPDATSGNYGVQDQQMALRWVQKNIPLFGGDPNSGPGKPEPQISAAPFIHSVWFDDVFPLSLIFAFFFGVAVFG